MKDTENIPNRNLSLVSFMNRREMAHFLGISERKLSTMVSRREIPVIKLGRSVRFDPIEVKKALKRLTIDAY
jgi:excisionase family DNA binding protein